MVFELSRFSNIKHSSCCVGNIMDDSDSSVFRRNQPGDRQRALDIMLPMVESEKQVASDIYCLVGRIYKDMFQDSHFTDTQSRDSSIHWWAKALFTKFTSAGTTYETFHSLRTFQHTIPSIKKQKWHTDTGRNKAESNRETGRRICFGVKSVINFWFIFSYTFLAHEHVIAGMMKLEGRNMV